MAFCPECGKAASTACRIASQQHWSTCSSYERLRAEERGGSLPGIRVPRQPALAPPDLPKPYRGVQDT